MPWNPAQYLRFADARRQPALDLLARIPLESPGRIVDLGCGAGNVTRLLAERWPTASILGVDSDRAMLARASGEKGRISWQLGDMAQWPAGEADGAPDLVFSNAALHWLGDHDQLLPRFLKGLAPGGVLAVQMPSNFDAPSHRLLRELAAEIPWKEKLAEARMGSVLSAADYHRLLKPLCSRLHVWETIYWHVLTGEDAIVEWMKGSTLLPYLDRLEAVDAEAFLSAYRLRLGQACPAGEEGETLFPFKRLFILAEA